MNDRVKTIIRQLEELTEREPVTLMEVCGTHTVTIFRSGLRALLPPRLKLLSGPGCPVCVTDQREIDIAMDFAAKGFTLATYGDMLRVPGSSISGKPASSLTQMRGAGADVKVVTSAIQCIDIAQNTDKQVIFFAVGFETTTPATAVLIKEAERLRLKNLSVYCAHKTVPAALRLLASREDNAVNGFLLPGNVSVIIGEAPYAFIADEMKKACVITGFEPESILAAIFELTKQIIERRPSLKNFYSEAVAKDGNVQATALTNEIFEPCDAVWRGLGGIERSGLRIRRRFSQFDAAVRFEVKHENSSGANKLCRCGDVLAGIITPPECGLFREVCTPLSPVGPCMVSAEGTCGAWFRWNKF